MIVLETNSNGNQNSYDCTNHQNTEEFPHEFNPVGPLNFCNCQNIVQQFGKVFLRKELFFLRSIFALLVYKYLRPHFEHIFADLC